MKNQYFSKLENTYYYGISRTFWHVLITIAALGTIVAIIAILYSYIPAGKEEVSKAAPPQKEAYPPQSEISFAELEQQLPMDSAPLQLQKNEIVAEEIKSPPQQNNITDKNTDGLQEFENAIASLKNVLPPQEFPQLWQGIGQYIYSDKRKYEVTKNEKYRTYVQDIAGFEQQVIEATHKNSFKGYKEKAAIVRGVSNILKDVPLDNRPDLAKELIKFRNQNFKKTIVSLDTLSNVLNLFIKEDLRKAYTKLERFILYNSNDGLAMISFLKEILPKFTKSQRYLATVYITDEYSNYYNNNLTGLIENTNQYLKHLGKLKPVQQAIGLEKYYTLYRGKNADRLAQIQRIENNHLQNLAAVEADYINAVRNAEVEFANKKQEKEKIRYLSLKSFAFALGAILFITVILLLLSMVRNVNRLAQAMIDNNKLTK